jgi:hypothetical protein
MKPGVYFDLGEADYSAVDALRSTFLREMLRTTPKAAKERGPGEDSEAKRFGRLLHMVVLEPDRAERDLIDEPEFKGVGSRAMRAEWLLRNAGKVPCKPKVREQLFAMRDSVLGDFRAGSIFKAQGRNEVSIVWDDPLGFRCKARLDRMFREGPRLAVVDLKSTRNAQSDLFMYDCAQYGYFTEALFYLRALDVTQGEYERPFFFIAVEKVAPHRVEVYELRRSDRALAMQKMLRGMEIYGECLRTNEWPDKPIFGNEGVA